MKIKRVQWFTLQKRQRLQSLVLRKDRDLKKVELEQGMIRQKEVYSCEYESKNFLGKTNEEGIEFKKNLMMCFDNGSYIK